MERVRFAPSPTGPLHIGGLRTALFNYLFTKNKGGRFVVRIEDTDQNRKVEGSEEYIFEALKWCGIEPDESPIHHGDFGPYRQSERLAIYKEYIEKLIENEKAYYAFDSSEELAQARKEAEDKGEGFKYGSQNRMLFKNALSLSAAETEECLKGKYVVRLKVGAFDMVNCEDLLRGNIRVSTNEIEDKILFKSDGFPTYHFANVVDDHLMKITTVVRGEEWLPSLPIHQLLYKGFGWDTPAFLHLPLILNPSGKGKLSKRDGDKNGYPVFPLSWIGSNGYKEKGFLPEAHLNYIAQLGWSIGEDIVSLDHMVKLFSVDNLQKGGARFDFDKAKWINQQYIANFDVEDLVVLAKAYVDETYLENKDKFRKALQAVQKRIQLLSDVDDLINVFYKDPLQYDEKGLKKITKKMPYAVLERLLDDISFEGDNLKEQLARIAEEENTGLGHVMQIMRMALVGNLSGPDISTIVKIIGKDVTLKRIEKLSSHLKK